MKAHGGMQTLLFHIFHFQETCGASWENFGLSDLRIMMILCSSHYFYSVCLWSCFQLSDPKTGERKVCRWKDLDRVSEICDVFCRYYFSDVSRHFMPCWISCYLNFEILGYENLCVLSFFTVEQLVSWHSSFPSLLFCFLSYSLLL